MYYNQLYLYSQTLGMTNSREMELEKNRLKKKKFIVLFGILVPILLVTVFLLKLHSGQRKNQA